MGHRDNYLYYKIKTYLAGVTTRMWHERLRDVTDSALRTWGSNLLKKRKSYSGG